MTAVDAHAQAPAPVAAVKQGPYSLDDIGLGERFADDHRDHVRFVPLWKKWITWDCQRWAPDTGAVRVTAHAKETAQSIYDDLDQLRIDLQAAAGDDAEVKRLEGIVGSVLRQAKRAASEPGLRAMLKLAESEPGIAIDPDGLDADTHILNTPSGIVDLRTGALEPHDPDRLCTHITTAAYDPHAAAPFWHATVDVIFDGDADLIRYVQRIVGLALHGNRGERLLPVGLGPGGTGKPRCSRRSSGSSATTRRSPTPRRSCSPATAAAARTRTSPTCTAGGS